MNKKKKPEAHPVDLFVGTKLRLLRKKLGISQEKVASEVGLTFQQIQKYEKGLNRISCSKLYEFAKLLGVSIQDFFEGFSHYIGEEAGDPYLADSSPPPSYNSPRAPNGLPYPHYTGAGYQPSQQYHVPARDGGQSSSHSHLNLTAGIGLSSYDYPYPADPRNAGRIPASGAGALGGRSGGGSGENAAIPPHGTAAARLGGAAAGASTSGYHPGSADLERIVNTIIDGDRESVKERVLQVLKAITNSDQQG